MYRVSLKGEGGEKTFFLCPSLPGHVQVLPSFSSLFRAQQLSSPPPSSPLPPPLSHPYPSPPPSGKMREGEGRRGPGHETLQIVNEIDQTEPKTRCYSIFWAQALQLYSPPPQPPLTPIFPSPLAPLAPLVPPFPLAAPSSLSPPTPHHPLPSQWLYPLHCG
jgi:hypothetical protein